MKIIVTNEEEIKGWDRVTWLPIKISDTKVRKKGFQKSFYIFILTLRLGQVSSIASLWTCYSDFMVYLFISCIMSLDLTILPKIP